MKLAIGTAQFGLDYGVSNQNGQVSSQDVDKILKAAISVGITTIDTAADYGGSEQALGSSGMDSFDVVSKFGAVPEVTTDVKGWVCEKIEESLVRLNVSSMYGLLLHRPYELLGVHGDIIYEALREAKSQGLIKNIGISISDPTELTQLIDRFDINIVQAPMSIFDRRLHSSGWLERLQKLGVQVHVRSVFLQGLLLMNSRVRPDYFGRWSPLFQNYDNWLTTSNISALEACIGFVKQFSSVDKIIVGIASPSHLDGIFKALTRNAVIATPSDIQSDDVDLINPAKWPL
jgi:aryl-alcohol dehydrogenase-like predicted oxidoreductase